MKKMVDYLGKISKITNMRIEQEGIYVDASGQQYDVINTGDDERPYYRAYFNGGWYNVNEEPDNFPFDQVEIVMVKRIGDIPSN